MKKVLAETQTLPAGRSNAETQFREDRCTQFRVIVMTDTARHKHKQDRLQYTAPIANAQSNKP